MELLEQRDFIKGIPPFDKCRETVIEKLIKNLDIAYFPSDELLMRKGAMPEFLYFIIKGVVQEQDDEGGVTIYTHHTLFDAISLIENYARGNFKAIEETICYILPRAIFMELLHEDPSLEHYFFQSIAQKLESAVLQREDSTLANLMTARVEDIVLHPPLIVDPNLSVYEAVKLLHAQKRDVLLVRGEGEMGIVTDFDFREKFILRRGRFEDPIVSVANFPVITVPPQTFLFNAQMEMIKAHIKHLVVINEKGEALGILDQLMLASFFASHTYAVASEIERAEDIEALKHASEGLLKITDALFAKGVNVRYIARLISQLNSKIFEKLFYLLAPEGLIGHAAVIVMGSEGREEQILKTDQDNALILSDSCEIEDSVLADFCARYTSALIDFGYPSCPGDIMLSNPQWRMPLQLFEQEIGKWIASEEEEGKMKIAIFYDAVAVAGERSLLDQLKMSLISRVKEFPMFYAHFARAVENFETPLGIFTDFIVEKRGVHKEELDIKKGAIFAIVHGVRSLAIEYGITETNSVERLKKLNDAGLLEKTFTQDLIASFTFLLRLRLKCNIERIKRGEEISNYIAPKELTRIEKDLLKEALKMVDKFKKFLIYHYKLTLLG